MARSEETVERQALVAWFDAATAGRHTAWSLHEIGDAMCFVDRNEPSIPVNRVLGLGSRSVPTIDQLVEIRGLYADVGVGRFFLHVIPEALGPNRAELLAEAGYRKYRGSRRCAGLAPVHELRRRYACRYRWIIHARWPRLSRFRCDSPRFSTPRRPDRCTRRAYPGGEQHSYRNIERAGFSAIYLRENWIPSDH